MIFIASGTCTDGDIRLVDGIIENEGRVEVCYKGVWGTICDNGWDTTDGHIACTQLGHPDLGNLVCTYISNKILIFKLPLHFLALTLVMVYFQSYIPTWLALDMKIELLIVIKVVL